MRVVKHSQSSQNSNLAVPLQYLKKEVRDEVDFLHEDKHQNFPQIDFNNLGIKMFYKVVLSLLMGMIKHPQNMMQNIQILNRVSHVCCCLSLFVIYYVPVVVIKDRINKMHSKYFNVQL